MFSKSKHRSNPITLIYCPAHASTVLTMILKTYDSAMTHLRDLLQLFAFARWLKCIQLSKKQRKGIIFCHRKGVGFTFYVNRHKVIYVNSQVMQSSVYVRSCSHKELGIMRGKIYEIYALVMCEPGLTLKFKDKKFSKFDKSKY